jgi:hypothetical protein
MEKVKIRPPELLAAATWSTPEITGWHGGCV